MRRAPFVETTADDRFPSLGLDGLCSGRLLVLDWAGSIGKIGQRPNESTQEMGDSGVVFFILLFWDFLFL